MMSHLEAENSYAAASTAHLESLVGAVYEEILARVQLTDVTYPETRAQWSYYRRTVEGLEHPISCRRPAGAPFPSADPNVEDPDEAVVLDENALAKGHAYFHVGDSALSSDQRLLAYATDTSGAELYEIAIRDLESGKDLEERIVGAYYGVAFDADAATLFYTRPDDAMRPHQIWRHRLGSPQSDDNLVWQEDDERFFLSVGTTKDFELVVFSAESHVTSEHRVVPAGDAGREPVVVAPRRQGVLYSVEHAGGELLILSNEEAENFRLLRAPLADLGQKAWKVLLAHREDVRIETFDVVTGHVLVAERGHATTAVRILSLAGDAAHVIEAPDAGTVQLAQNLDFDAREVRYTTTSLIEPPTLHAYDLEVGSTTRLWRQPAPGYDPSRYRTARRFATSGDGTEVPLTLAWRADRPERAGPCLLYGYGSYEHSSDPAYSSRRPIHPLLDRGVLFAIAHVRGGGELGRVWYLDGKLGRKRHSFEDFVACARLLVSEGLSTPAELAINGGSAGGLLVGASLNEAPELFGAVVAEVPFVDVLTTTLDVSLPLTVIEHEEWGNPISDEEAYFYIRGYSPYDNVVPLEAYPKMLVTAGLNDPRVSYFEPAKWVQKLRASDGGGGGQILLKTEMVAGHGGPSGRFRHWQEHALRLAFVLDATGAARANGDNDVVAARAGVASPTTPGSRSAG